MVSKKDTASPEEAPVKKTRRTARVKSPEAALLTTETQEAGVGEPAGVEAPETAAEAPKPRTRRKMAASAEPTPEKKTTTRGRKKAAEADGEKEPAKKRPSRSKKKDAEQAGMQSLFPASPEQIVEGQQEETQVLAKTQEEPETSPIQATSLVKSRRRTKATAQVSEADNKIAKFLEDNSLPQDSYVHNLPQDYVPLSQENEVLPEEAAQATAPGTQTVTGEQLSAPAADPAAMFLAESVLQQKETAKTATEKKVEDKKAAETTGRGSFSQLVHQMINNHAKAVEAPEPVAAESVPEATDQAEGAAQAEDQKEEECVLTELEQKVCANVALEEQHVSLNDGVSFLTHFQYGTGSVETVAMGDTSTPGSTQPSEPENAFCFFRTCRRVITPDTTSTPLPEEGYWIPSHPSPRAFHQLSQQAQTDLNGTAPGNDEAPAEATTVSPIAGAQPDFKNAGRILVCWVGKVDISAALRHDSINPGPIRMLLEHVPNFDHVLLLTTTNQSVLDTLRNWLLPCLNGKTLEVQRTSVTDLSDHTTVCQAAVEAVEGLISRFNLPADGTGITFHLSPGSPVTHAILLLISTIRYRGITLMQTRLTGLGKAPDILTISMSEVLKGQSISTENMPQITVSMPAHPAMPVSLSEPAQEEEFDLSRYQHSRTGRKAAVAARGKGSARGDDLLRRFKTTRKGQHARAMQRGQATAGTTTIVQETLPIELDMPIAVQEENTLRSPAVNIGRPGRVSPTALQPKEGDPPLISSALGAVYKKMQRVATMYLPILLVGESGCGKSRLARYLHEWSGRNGKFVSLDCAGLTDEMLASELFGRPGGNGIRPREGAFRKARSGTLFLENVNLLTPTQQSILLRVLAPVGETKLYLPARLPFPACTVRVRIIASAEPTLLADIREGRFRTDLYYRLAGVSSTLPAVREYSYSERENLLRSFLVNLQHKLGQCWNFSGDAWQTLLDEKWPGNLREVSRILQQICLLSDADSTITREDVLQQLRQGRFDSVPVASVPKDSEGEHIVPRPFRGSEYGIGGPVNMAMPQDTACFGPVLNDDDDYDDQDNYEDMPDDMDDSDGNGDFFVLGSGLSLDKALEQARDNKILEAMDRARGNRSEAAALLGMTPNQLSYALTRIKNAEQNG